MVGVLILFSLPARAPPLPTTPAAAKAAAARAVPGGAADGLCVSKASLAQTCGSPPAAPCKQEGAARACFGKQSALTAPKPKANSQ